LPPALPLTSARGVDFGLLKGADMALNCANADLPHSILACSPQRASQFAKFIRVSAAVQVSDLASAGLTLVSVVTHTVKTALHSRPCSVG
jgi:hypothetical protein